MFINFYKLYIAVQQNNNCQIRHELASKTRCVTCDYISRAAAFAFSQFLHSDNLRIILRFCFSILWFLKTSTEILAIIYLLLFQCSFRSPIKVDLNVAFTRQERMILLQPSPDKKNWFYCSLRPPICWHIGGRRLYLKNVMEISILFTVCLLETFWILIWNILNCKQLR